MAKSVKDDQSQTVKAPGENPRTPLRTALSADELKTNKSRLKTLESPHTKSDQSRKKLAGILSLQRKRARNPRTLNLNESLQGNTISPEAKQNGSSLPSSSSTPSTKKQTKESSSSSAKKKKGLAKLLNDSNIFRRDSPSTKKHAPIRQQLSVPRPVTMIEEERKAIKQASGTAQQIACTKLDYKKLEAKMRNRQRKLSCWSLACCFITVGYVFAALTVCCIGLYFAAESALLLSRERALTDSLTKEWTMDSDQCFVPNPMIYKNMSQQHLRLVDHCERPKSIVKGADVNWKCINDEGAYPNCTKGQVRDLKLGNIYTFSNIDEFYRPANV